MEKFKTSDNPRSMLHPIISNDADAFEYSRAAKRFYKKLWNLQKQSMKKDEDKTK